MTHPAIHLVPDGDDFEAWCDRCGAWTCGHLISDCMDALVDLPCRAAA